MTLALVSDLLACPVCAEGLCTADRVLRCGQGHTFDVARQGYVSLLSGKNPHPGDTALMVQARERVQRSGVFAGTARAVRHALPQKVRTLADVGGGTGYYAAAVLAQQDRGRAVVLDSSKPALQRAAQIHDRIAAVGCDIVASLPIRTSVMDAIIVAFGPRNVDEFARILNVGGVAIMVTPEPDHLSEIAPAMGMLAVEPDKTARLDDQMCGMFDLVDRTQLVERLLVSRDLAGDLAQMGPAGFHATPAQFTKRATRLAPVVTATLAVTVTTYQRR